MKVLIGCERSGVVRRAFREVGHDAWSCDIEPADDGSEYHLQCDVLTVLDRGWDLGIFHPPCTRLCNSGVRWLAERNLWAEMREGALLFLACLNAAQIPRVCVENPIPHGYALELIGRKYDQTIQPWQFGHGETKATCLWLRGLPKLTPTDIVDGRDGRIWKMPPSKERSRLRSQTYPGIAAAMAHQWSNLERNP